MALMISKLYNLLYVNYFNFYFCRKELLNKLFMVMGIDNEKLSILPDNSYVLTADNTKKILAILMRFRYKIS